jgi:hypothetical protein
MQTFSKQRLEGQKCQQRAGDKPLCEIEQIAVHKVHLLSQWATSKVKQCGKIEKKTVNQHNTQTAGAGRWISDFTPEKGHEAKKQTTSKPTQRKPNSKAGQLVDHRADVRNLRTSHTSLREELTKQLLLKKGKKLAHLPKHLTRLRQSFCLNTNTRTGYWKSNTRTTKTKILLFLNLNFFLCVCLFCSLFVCPLPLPVDSLLLFFFFLLSLFC